MWLGATCAGWSQADPAPNGGAPNEIQQKNRFWQASVGGGEYVVELSRIVSVSRHQYVLDASSVIVDEVVVDTIGQALVRFYYLKPITDEMRGSGVGQTASRIIDRGRELVDRGAEVAGTNIHNMVIKKFPETTHAKEIEYRLQSEDALTKLYSSVRGAWDSGRGRKFSEK